MKARCKVTFEFELRPPETWEGQIEGGVASTIFSRAVRAAQDALLPRLWTSVVAVIVSRDQVEEQG